MFCPNCGAQNPDAATTCQKCGFNLKGTVGQKFKGTMLMMNSPGALNVGGSPTQVGSPAPPPAGVGARPPAVGVPRPTPAAAPRPAASPRPAARPATKMKGTMIGVAPPATGFGAQGGLTQPQPQGGLTQPQPQGGLTQPQPQGGLTQPQPVAPTAPGELPAPAAGMPVPAATVGMGTLAAAVPPAEPFAPTPGVPVQPTQAMSAAALRPTEAMAASGLEATQVAAASPIAATQAMAATGAAPHAAAVAPAPSKLLNTVVAGPADAGDLGLAPAPHAASTGSLTDFSLPSSDFAPSSAASAPRSPKMVLILGLVTFGIYGIFWFAGTAEDLKRRGASLPPLWQVLIPILNLVWLWKWSTAVEEVTAKEQAASTTFLKVALLGPFGWAWMQGAFNQLQ